MFVMYPILGILGFALLATVRWTSSTPIGYWFSNHTKYITAIVVFAFSTAIGWKIFGSKLSRYKENSQARYLFDSERDGRIAEWQRKAVSFFCGVVMPFLGLLISWLTGQ